MKKSFLSIVALFAVALTVFTLTSCGKDEDEKKTIIEGAHYTYNLAFTDDVFTFYDVKVVATYSGKTETYAFNDTAKCTFSNSEYTGMRTGEKKFFAEKGKDASIICTLTLKSNWEELIKEKGKATFCFNLHAAIDQSDNSDSQLWGAATGDKKQVFENIGDVLATACSLK